MGRDTLICQKCSQPKAGARTRKRKNGTAYSEWYCVPCTRTSTTRYRDTCPEQRLISSCKARAVQQGLPFDLTTLYVPPTCPVFGIPLTTVVGPRTDRTASVDRIKPELGYVQGNVVVISWRANRLKNDATLEELQKLARFVAGHTAHL